MGGSRTGAAFDSIEAIGDPTAVLVRVDLNSPVEGGIVLDNRRFARHATTVEELSDAGHHVIVLAHQGRPGRDDFVSLEPHTDILSDHVSRPIDFCDETTGERAERAISQLSSGEILMLENVRMHPDELADRTPEEHARSDLVRSLAALVDVYVGDAYSTAHRAHASIVGLPRAAERAVAGRVMEAEYTANSAIQARTFDGPVTMVLGGTKADDLFRVIEGVESTVDTFLRGGVSGELCLRARGYDLGYDVETDLFDSLWADHETAIRALLERFDDRLVLPQDLAYASEGGERREMTVEGSAKTQPYYDIGSETVEEFRPYIQESEAVFVKGALGVFEDERFSNGTVSVLQAIGEADVFSVVGGGDTSRAIDIYDLDPADYDHVSIAGGAYVRALAGESLPGVDALRRE